MPILKELGARLPIGQHVRLREAVFGRSISPFEAVNFRLQTGEVQNLK